MRLDSRATQRRLTTALRGARQRAPARRAVRRPRARPARRRQPARGRRRATTRRGPRSRQGPSPRLRSALPSRHGCSRLRWPALEAVMDALTDIEGARPGGNTIETGIPLASSPPALRQNA
ncbi:hypothetical protein ADK37_37310 [Streptomyces resistomycificus]|uniref:Uncharacterized protein n=1 Tax=Streptomyces resistomycificus TaxID=67356 RepID=A0A0L8KTS7_9ACTN|nr:hypothetical protein ADK37_37310 [Streptomyces resistomycificus]